MSAAIELLPLLVFAVLPVLFIIQFFSAHSRKAAWATPARHAATTFDNVTDLDTARSAPTIPTAPIAA